MYVIYENDFGVCEVVPYFDVKVGLLSEDRLVWRYERGVRKDFYRFDTEREALEWLSFGERVGVDSGSGVLEVERDSSVLDVVMDEEDVSGDEVGV